MADLSHTPRSHGRARRAPWRLSPELVGALAFCAAVLVAVVLGAIGHDDEPSHLLVLGGYGLVTAILVAVVAANVARAHAAGAPAPAPLSAGPEGRERRLSLIVEALQEGLVLHDRDLRLREYNEAAAKMVGFTPATLGRRLEDLGPWRMLDENGTVRPFSEHPAAVVLRTGEPVRDVVVGGAVAGKVLWTRLNALPIFDADGEIEGVLTTFTDITSERSAQTALQSSEAVVSEVTEALSWQALHDPLTQLPNRAQLVDRLASGLEQARVHGGLTGLLFVGLDRFKNVNDTIGHDAADHLLVEVAGRLRAASRAGDLVARLGADEFVVVAEALTGPEEAVELAERLRAAVAVPVSLPTGNVTVTASVGIAFDHDHRPGSLLRDADAALHKAKHEGRDRVEVYDDSLRSETVRKVAAEQMLRQALEDDGLRVLYQPIIDLRTGQVLGAEALVRILGPGGELLTPAAFIGVAEETGLIVPVGARVLDDACCQLMRWREELGELAPRSVSVNLSARQITTQTIPAVVERTLDRYGVPPGALTLELTETSLIEAGHAALDTVEDLHDLGVRLAIDDFGTGYSSLSYLKRFPVDIVKVDRSFVGGLGQQQHDTEIVRAVIALGQSLGLTTVAEGVETVHQLQVLRSLGCDHGQGFLFARPVAAGELGAVIERIRDLFASNAAG